MMMFLVLAICLPLDVDNISERWFTTTMTMSRMAKTSDEYKRRTWLGKSRWVEAHGSLSFDDIHTNRQTTHSKNKLEPENSRESREKAKRREFFQNENTFFYAFGREKQRQAIWRRLETEGEHSSLYFFVMTSTLLLFLLLVLSIFWLTSLASMFHCFYIASRRKFIIQTHARLWIYAWYVRTSGREMKDGREKNPPR